MNITTLLTILNQLQVYHWNTTSHEEHLVFGEAYSNLQGLFDTLIETYYGKHGRLQINGNIKVQNYSENGATMIDECIKVIEAFNFNTEPDLDNIKQDILNELSHIKYKLSLK